eukprot:44176-Prorocentrum_lima.AAC.1
MTYPSEDDYAGHVDHPNHGVDKFEDNAWQACMSCSSLGLPNGVTATPKIPPSFDGNMSWPAFQEVVR